MTITNVRNEFLNLGLPGDIWTGSLKPNMLHPMPGQLGRRSAETYRAVLGDFHLPHATLCITLLLPTSKNNI